MAKDIKLVATLSGKQYTFEYVNQTIEGALKEFFFDDCHPLIDDPDYGCFPIDLWLPDTGAHKPIQVMFHLCCFDHYYAKGWNADGPYLWSEFLTDIIESREEYERRKTVGIKNVSYSCKKTNDVTKAKEIIALWSDWCMDWDDENLWLDYMVKHPKGHCNRQHLQEKWDYCYEKYGNKAAMNMFWRELDNDNRAILTEYITTQWHKN